MTTPNDPTSGPGERPADLPRYVDPATQQQLYMDPVTGEFRSEPVAGPPPGAGPGDQSGVPGYPPPYGSSPYPGQPYPGQPYPGQPYPGQQQYGGPTPYPGGQYPGPQYQGQQYPPPQYPAPYGYGYSAPQSTSGLAIASLVTSIAGIFLMFCWGAGAIAGIVGAILGHVARRKINSTNQRGSGLALAGVIVGWIAFGLGLLVVAFEIVAVSSS